MLSFGKRKKQKIAEMQRVEQQEQRPEEVKIQEQQMQKPIEVKNQQQQEQQVEGSEMQDKQIVEVQQEVVEENIFPAAEKMKEMSSQNWRVLTDEEVLKRLESAGRKGRREVVFLNDILTEKTIKALRKKGFTVVDTFVSKTPYYKVEW